MGASSEATNTSSGLAANKSQSKNGGGESQMKFPMKRDQAVRHLGPFLWECEKREIMEYDEIYFFNVNERVKNAGNHNLPGGAAYGKISDSAASNNGFDSDQ